MCVWDDSNSGGLRFRDENDFASNRAKRRRGGARTLSPTSPLQRSVSGSVTVFGLASQQQSSTSKSIALLLTQPSESTETHALNKLLRCFIDTEEHLSSDIWGFLREYRSDFFPLKPHATFVPAVMAFALVHFGRTSHDVAAIAASQRYYSQALINTSQAVQCETSAVTDEVALTVVMLSGYEDQMGNFDDMKLRSQGFSHLEGVTALMRAREQHGEITERSQSLNRFVRRRIVRSSITHGAAVSLPIQDGGFHNSKPVCDALYKCLVDIAVVRNKAFLELRATLSLPLEQRRAHVTKLQHIVKAVQEADARLETWRSCLPSEWQYQVHTVSDSQYSYCLSSSIFYSRTYHTYSDREMLLIWNTYRAARLVTLGLLIKMAAIDPSINQMLAKKCAFDFDRSVDKMRILVEDIAATIPVHFDAISKPPRMREDLIQRTPVSTAFHLVWPLLLASATLQIPDHLRDWVKSALLLVSQIGGSAVLARLAGMNLHTHLALQPQLG